MRLSVFLVAAIAVAAAGCPRSRAPDSPHAATADAPYELEDDLDLGEKTDQLAAMPPGSERSQLRQTIAGALASRLEHELTRNRVDRLDDITQQLALLWLDEPDAMPVELAPHVPVLVRTRAKLARAGLDRETVLVLALLVATDKAHADAHHDELEQIVAFAENLGQARLGPLGVGTGTIGVLEPVVTFLPASGLADRYVEAVITRANIADAALMASGAATGTGRPPDSPVFRLALRASRDVAAALAVAHRSDEIALRLSKLVGLGRMRELQEAAHDITRPEATAVEWAGLARMVRTSFDDREDSPIAAGAALAVCRDGLVRFPDNPILLAAAAGHAEALDRIGEPIALLERARAASPGDAELADRLTSLYRERLGRLVFGGRGRTAAARLEELRAFYAQIDRAFPGHEWSTTLAESLATYGRGLVSLGDIAAARRELERSVRLKATPEALEMLGTIALKLGEFPAARTHLERGAKLGTDAPADKYSRAKLLRLAGDAARGAGDSTGAVRAWHQALEIWADLGETIELPPSLAGERFNEVAKLFWSLGMREEAFANFGRAVEADPGGADTHTQAVAYLLMQDELDRALDIFYDALGSDGVGDYYKVYLSLWILAEDRRAGRPDNRLATEYLATRDGTLWYDDVARYATGRISADVLAARATTPGRRAELTYYSAVLGPRDRDPKEVRRLLENVVQTGLVLFFEYDMARRFLGQ